MSDLSRRDIIKQGLGAFLAPKSAIKAVNSALKTIPNNSKVDLRRYGIDLASLMGAVLDGDENENFEIGADRSITLSNGREIPAETVAAIIKDGLKGLSLEELIEYMTSYMGSADYDDEFGVFSDIVKQAVDKVGFRTFIRAVIAADNYGVNSTPSIENSKLEKLQDLVVNITRFDVLPGSDNIIFGGGGSYTDQLDDLVNLLRKQGVIKPVEAAKMLRNQKADIDRLDAAQREWQTKQSHDTQQSEPDWYNDNWRDPFYKSKERFHEHHIKRLKFFTEAYSSLYKSVIKEGKVTLAPFDEKIENATSWNDAANNIVNFENRYINHIKEKILELYKIGLNSVADEANVLIELIGENSSYKELEPHINDFITDYTKGKKLFDAFILSHEWPDTSDNKMNVNSDNFKANLYHYYEKIVNALNTRIEQLNLPSHKKIKMELAEELNPYQVYDRAGFIEGNVYHMHSLYRLYLLLSEMAYLAKRLKEYYNANYDRYNTKDEYNIEKATKEFREGLRNNMKASELADHIIRLLSQRGRSKKISMIGIIMGTPNALRLKLNDDKNFNTLLRYLEDGFHVYEERIFRKLVDGMKTGETEKIEWLSI